MNPVPYSLIVALLLTASGAQAQTTKPSSKPAPSKPSSSKPSTPTSHPAPSRPTQTQPRPTTTSRPTTPVNHPTTTSRPTTSRPTTPSQPSHPNTTPPSHTNTTPSRPGNSNPRPGNTGTSNTHVNVPAGRSGVTHNTNVRITVASPHVNARQVTAAVKTDRKGNVTSVVYTNRGGQKVFAEKYNKNRTVLVRNFYREGRADRAYTYNRIVIRGHEYYGYRPYHWGVSFYYTPYYRPFIRSNFLYTWLWLNDPWYTSYYRYYYTPYAYYNTPSAWLTDYYWQSILSDDYNANADVIASQQATIDAQKDQIAAMQAKIDQATKDQVQAQIDAQLKASNEEKEISLEDKLRDPNHLFVVTAALDAKTIDDESCSLSTGDVIKLAAEGVNSDEENASMTVVTSRSAYPGSKACKAGSQVTVALSDLQEFENELARRIDEGTEKMSSDESVKAMLNTSGTSLE